MVKIISVFLLSVISGGVLFALPSESELLRLQRENRELRDKVISLENELSGYRMWLGNIPVDPSDMSLANREKRAIIVLNEVLRLGNRLSMSALSVRDDFRKFMNEMPIGPARKAQLEMRLDELTDHASAFAGVSIPSGDGVGSCRILAVNRDLKVVILSAGTEDGVFNGMVFRVKQNQDLKFRVKGVRFDGAVAEIVSGNINDAVAGMEVTALQQVGK